MSKKSYSEYWTRQFGHMVYPFCESLIADDVDRSYWREKIRIVTALDLIKYLQQIKREP